MIAQAREALRRKPLAGVVASVAIHAVLLFALLWVHPAPTPTQKRGDALIVELPSSPESGRGTPGAERDAPATPDPPAPAPKTPSIPQPPAPVRPRPPAPTRSPATAQTPPAPKAEPRESPRAVASAPQPPPATEGGDMPAEKSAPQAPAEAAPPQPVNPEPPAPAAPPVASAPPSPPGPVASIPPGPVDSRAVLRRGGGGGGSGAGGAGGLGGGRGGIVGEAIPLDTKDDDLQDYFERIRRLIKQNWVYPCIKNSETRVCEYKSTALIVEFGILKPGPLQYIEVRKASPYVIYDEYAVNAIKLASPFPPVPPAIMARMARGSTGASILVRFVYVHEAGITNMLR